MERNPLDARYAELVAARQALLEARDTLRRSRTAEVNATNREREAQAAYQKASDAFHVELSKELSR